MNNLLCESLAHGFPFQLQSRNPKEDCFGFLEDYATRQRNAILWVSLVAVTALLLEKLVKLFVLWAKGSRIPGPPFASSFARANFGSRQNFVDFLAESHEKFGSVFKLWLGPSQLLVSIRDPALVKEMLSKAADKLPSTGKAFRLAFGRSSLFFCSYDEAKQTRESLAMELNKKMLERADEFPNCIMEKVDELISNGSNDSKVFSQRLAFSVIGTALFGNSFLAWSKATSYEDLLMMTAKDAAFWGSYRVAPLWNHGFWSYQSLCMKLRCLTQDIVQLSRKSHEDKDRNLCNRTIRSRKMAASGETFSSGSLMQDKFFSQELDGHLTASEENCGNILGLMFHGSVAMAGLIDSIFKRLITDQELQDKVYLDISLVKQCSGEDETVGKMHLLLATIHESARLLSTGSLLQRCSLKDDLCLGNGVIIPAGTVVVVPAQLLQMDNSIWGSDASNFNPHRFLSNVGKVPDITKDTSFTDARNSIPASFSVKDPNEVAAYLSFGSGVRACVGQKFVINEVAAFFALFLQRYEVRLHPESANDPKATANPQIVFLRRKSRMFQNENSIYEFHWL
ncbi:hypothetical protein Tsubulata_004557 [Turnera subulata]|uniref:Cytochrome P450 n=1 Tax=Turnera subulata TaxID=218843 RepID=A0A9Q0FRQ6_9ROSI|nr:hypothetical protein Tsubulata_004557 [Turnera subulata]